MAAMTPIEDAAHEATASHAQQRHARGGRRELEQGRQLGGRDLRRTYQAFKDQDFSFRETRRH